MRLVRNQAAETDAAEAGCDSFESTLGLLDGTLSPFQRTIAERHARQCSICGPMVRGWAPIGETLRDDFACAVELAKPDLAELSDRVMAQIDRRESRWLGRVAAALHFSQPVYAFAAAMMTAAALVIVPFVWPRGTNRVKAAGQAAHCDLDTDIHPELGEVKGESGFHIHALSFGHADGAMLTAKDGTPIIWVSERRGG